MTSDRLRDCESVHGFVGRICFKTGPPTRVGAELEWLVAPVADPALPVPLPQLHSRLGDPSAPFPGGSSLTFEPGGQVELSSPPSTSLSACWRRLQLDVDRLTLALAEHGLTIQPHAIDAARQPRRQLQSRRYDAMEAYFDTLEPSAHRALRAAVGRTMMASTAAVQVNLDAGASAAEIARRWRVLHDLGPTMVAAFANSPVHAGRHTGWKSTRQHVWQLLDPSRTAPPAGDDPISAWADYVLDAPVMMLRRDDAEWLAAPGFTMRSWVTGRTGLERPTEDDLAYHMSTLFPPVRPRAWFEVRYVDAQAPPWWPVPIAVLWALLSDVPALAEAEAATEPVRAAWRPAARHGLDHPALAASARRCFEAALAALARAGADAELVGRVEAFHRRYPARGRCPADEHPARTGAATTREAAP